MSNMHQEYQLELEMMCDNEKLSTLTDQQFGYFTVFSTCHPRGTNVYDTGLLNLLY